MATECADGAPEQSVSARDPKGRMTMQLYIVKGSFVTADTGEQCAMNAAVWSRMPEDLLWRVLQFVPAVKLFQWQLVSHQWRQMLTSHDFRRGLVATAAAAGSGRGAAGRAAAEQGTVIAYVTSGCEPISYKNKSGSGNSDVKVVDIDLSFVPSSFWRSDTYCVLTTMDDGLVFISNERSGREAWPPKDNQYCVINPVTRTCKILPKVPFALGGISQSRIWQSSRPVTITNDDEGGDWMMVATLDLEGAGHWTRTDGLVPRELQSEARDWEPADCIAVCDGDTFFYICESQCRACP